MCNSIDIRSIEKILIWNTMFCNCDM